MSTAVVGLRSREREEQLEKALSIVERPEGVGKPDVLFGLDHSGDEAVHIVFPASTRVKLTDSRIDVLAKFSEAIYEQLRKLRLKEIAYVRFTETRR